MKKTHAFVVVLVALAFALGACSALENVPSPTSPSPPTPPAQSSVKVVQAIPGDNATLRGGQDSATVTLEYEVSQADLDEAARTGAVIYDRACLSVDGETPLDGSCFWRKASGVKGQTEHLLAPSTLDNPKVAQTRFILASQLFRYGSGQQEVERITVSSVLPRTYNWQW